MRTTLAIAASVLIISSFMAAPSYAATNCQNLFAKYLKAPGHKAFATTLGNDPGFHPTSCIFFSGFTLKKLAEKKAVEQCNRIRRKADGGKCKVISSK